MRRYLFFLFILLVPVCVKSQFLHQNEQDAEYSFTPLEGGLFHKVYDKQTNKYGITNSQDSVIIPVKYRNVVLEKYENNTKCFFYVYKNFSQMGVFSNDGKVIVPCIYESISPQYDRNKILKSFIVRKDGYCGVLNAKGEIVIPTNCYSNITHTNRGGYNVTCGGSNGCGLRGFVDEYGNVIIPADKYSSVYKLNDDYFSVVKDNKSSLCDKYGRVLFTTKYTSLGLVLYNNKLCVETRLGAKRGVMGFDGKEIVPIIPEDYWKLEKNGSYQYYIHIDKNGFYGVKDINKRVIIPNEFDYIYLKSDKEFCANKNGYEAVFDTCGKTIIPCGKYNFVVKQKKYYSVEYMSKEGACDLNGHEIIRPLYNKVSSTFAINGYFIVKNNGFEGVVDTLGNYIIPCRYSKVETNVIRYSDKQFISVQLNGKWGICDKFGKEIIPPIYDKIRSGYIKGGQKFPEYFVVKNGTKEGLIAFDGTPIFPAEYFEKVSLYNDIIEASSGDWKCTYDLNGKLLSDSKIDNEWKSYYNKGLSFFEKKDYINAAKCFDNANAVKKDYSSYFNLALCYYNTNKFKDAIRYFQQSIKLNAPSTTKERANKLIEYCYQYRNEQQKRRNAEVTNFIAGFFNVGISIYRFTQTQKLRQTKNVNPYVGLEDYTDYDSDNSSVDNKMKQKCGFCAGKGSVVEYTANYGIDKRPYCDECGKNVVSGHYHKTCPRCGGSGNR